MVATNNNDYLMGPGTITPTIGRGRHRRPWKPGGPVDRTSNVDMATEFTDLIVYQQGYEPTRKC